MLRKYSRHPYFDALDAPTKKKVLLCVDIFFMSTIFVSFFFTSYVVTKILHWPFWLAFWAGPILGIVVWLVLTLGGFYLLVTLLFAAKETQKKKAAVDDPHE